MPSSPRRERPPHRTRAPRAGRRKAEETRRAILEAAQKRLVEGGPDALRLQDVAADLGLSHPAILHHFGSREGLLQALVRHALDGLRTDLIAAMERPAGPAAGTAERLLERVFETLGDRGHARLIAWMALTGRGAQADAAPPADRTIRDLAEAVEARRHPPGGAPAARSPAPSEDTLFSVVLVALAVLGDAVLGDGVWRSAGRTGDPATRRRFRSWLGRLVATHLASGDEGGRPRGQ